MSAPPDFVSGCHPTPADIRALSPRFDVASARDVLVIPAVYDLRGDLLPVRNQKRQGACVAFATCASLEFFGGAHHYLAPQFIYNCRPRLFGSDDGMYLSQAVKIARDYGCPSESVYPYGKQICTKSDIAASVFAKATGAKIKSWADVDTVEEAKAALIQHGPLLLALPVYEGTPFWKKDGAYLGGHCVSIMGYNSFGFILRNSWGRTWNGDGHIVCPYTDWSSKWECMCLIDDDTVAPDISHSSCFPCFGAK